LRGKLGLVRVHLRLQLHLRLRLRLLRLLRGEVRLALHLRFHLLDLDGGLSVRLLELRGNLALGLFHLHLHLPLDHLGVRLRGLRRRLGGVAEELVRRLVARKLRQLGRRVVDVLRTGRADGVDLLLLLDDGRQVLQLLELEPTPSPMLMDTSNWLRHSRGSMSTHAPERRTLRPCLVLADQLEHHAEQVHEPFREVARDQVHAHVRFVRDDVRLGGRLGLVQAGRVVALDWRDQPVESSLKPFMYSIRLMDSAMLPLPWSSRPTMSLRLDPHHATRAAAQEVVQIHLVLDREVAPVHLELAGCPWSSAGWRSLRLPSIARSATTGRRTCAARDDRADRHERG
jgi:hypothetical protein